jgi:hypothetical protein
MNLKDHLREWLGDEWVKMLVLFVMLAVLPIGTLVIREYALSVTLAAIFLAPFFAYVLARHHWGPTVVHKVLETTWGIIVLLLLASLGVFGVHRAFQEWYPHTFSTFVYTDGNWMDGEQRTCSLSTRRKPYELDCTVTGTVSEPHQFDVSYTGANPDDLPQDTVHTWTCKRGAGSISCEEVKPR